VHINRTGRDPLLHFVVVTQPSGNTFLINDPLTANPERTQLDAPSYQNTAYYTHRFAAGNGTPRKSLIAVAKSPIELLVTDSQGRRTEINSMTGESFNEIPNAYYLLEGLSAEDPSDQSMPAVNNEPVKVFYVADPNDDQYGVATTGTGN